MEGAPSEASRRTPPSRTFNATATTSPETWIKVGKIVNLEQPVDKPIAIFKVPKQIREVNPKAYDPVVASIGPFHHCQYCWSSVMQTKSQLDSEAFKPVASLSKKKKAASCGHFDRAYPYSTSAMQNYKWRCVWHLLSHHGNDPERANQLLDECLVKLKEKNDEVRSCYSEELPPWMDDGKLASIMLLDGCFIIYLMLNWEELWKMEAEGEKRIQSTIETEEGHVVLNIKEKDKLLVAGLFTFDIVVYDLLKLENQIPFFIELLFIQLKPCEDKKIDLVDLALELFEGIHPEESKSFRDKGKKLPGEYHHLLHLFYSSRIPVGKAQEPASAPGCIHHAIECIESKWKKVEAAIECKKSKGKKMKDLTSKPKWIPSAMELDRAGVKFQKNDREKQMKKKFMPLLTCGRMKKNEQPPDSFLNITFDRTKKKFMPLLTSGLMKIPPLKVEDHTGPLFHNLIAFEQCFFYTFMHITIYAIFMDCIIDQAEDVRLLKSEGILEHGLGNDQAVANLFNQLGCQIHFTEEINYLESQIGEINKFYDFKWNKWLAELKRDYFRSPWTKISFFAAIILLSLTVEQAVFSALSYARSS